MCCLFGTVVKPTLTQIVILILWHKGDVVVELTITFIEPVTMFVGSDSIPINRSYVSKIINDFQFLFARKVIANIVIMNLASAPVIFVFYKDSDRHGGARPRTEDFTTLTTGCLALRPLITPKIKHIDVGKLLDKRIPKSVHRLRIQPATVRDESNNTLVLYSV